MSADSRLDLLDDAANLLEEAAEESTDRSWRRNLLESLAATTRRTRRKIKNVREDEPLPERSATETTEVPEPDDPWSELRRREGGR